MFSEGHGSGIKHRYRFKNELVAITNLLRVPPRFTVFFEEE